MFGIYICDLSIIFMSLLIFEKYSYFLRAFWCLGSLCVLRRLLTVENLYIFLVNCDVCDFSIYYFRSLYIFFEDYCTKVWEISILIIGEHWRLGSLYIFKRLRHFRISIFFRSLLMFRISLYYLRDYNVRIPYTFLKRLLMFEIYLSFLEYYWCLYLRYLFNS